jgi:MtrB/PioB family decaheme-associated outer membrane protein
MGVITLQEANYSVRKNVMNKLIATISLSVLLSSIIIGTTVIKADGFEGDKKEQADIENWVCKYCPELPLWDIQLGTHLGLVTDEIYRNANYTGLDDNHLFFSGSVRNINPDGEYWITNFSNVGTDAEQLNSRYGVQGNFDFELDFKSIPVRKFDQLSSAFINPGSTVLRLSDDWSRSNNSGDFSDPALYTEFALGTNWDQLGLKFSYIVDTNFDYSFDYHRIEKNGLRESSANQFFQAVYIPLPVDSVIEDYSVRMDYLSDDWFGSIAVKFSKFDNNIDSLLFANPFTSLISGADATRISDDPDNTAVNASLNLRYSYMPRSFIKAYLSYALMQQDEQYLLYTTNQSLLNSLPQASLDGEVETQNLSLKVNHWFNKQLSLRAKYDFRDRYNKTDMQLYRPVITDIFSAAEIINIPYDLTKETAKVDFDWRFENRNLLSIGIKNHKMERAFQTVRKTSEDSVSARYRAYLNDGVQFYINAERSSRSGSAAELIDLISVDENPLLQRFNVSERDHYKLNVQFSLTPVEMPFSAIISVQYDEDDYDETELGLQYSWQNNASLDLNWHVMETVELGFFIDGERKETTLGGSENFAGRDWLVDTEDEVVSFGVTFSLKEVFDEAFSLSGSAQFSKGDTEITINNAGSISLLPVTESLWTLVELKANYQYSEQLDFVFSLVYQDFESHDFSIDNVVPGAAANLLTFSAMSNNYNLGYLQLSAFYRF